MDTRAGNSIVVRLPLHVALRSRVQRPLHRFGSSPNNNDNWSSSSLHSPLSSSSHSLQGVHSDEEYGIYTRPLTPARSVTKMLPTVRKFGSTMSKPSAPPPSHLIHSSPSISVIDEAAARSAAFRMAMLRLDAVPARLNKRTAAAAEGLAMRVRRPESGWRQETRTAMFLRVEWTWTSICD